MNSDIRQHICRLVREHVKSVYGNPTCIGSVKVLSEVLKSVSNVELVPMTVDVEAIPEVGQPLSMTSQGPNFNGHLIGETTEDGQVFLWDPSIDQINEHWKSELILPFCIDQNDMKKEFNGESLWFSTKVGRVILRYRATDHMRTAMSSDAWNIDYSDIVAAVLERLWREYGIVGNAGQYT